MPGSAEDIEQLRRLGGYESREDVLDDAVRSLLRCRPELRTKLAIAKYRNGTVSRNRAAGLVGLSSVEFSDHLNDREIAVEAGFLTDEERDENLDRDE